MGDMLTTCKSEAQLLEHFLLHSHQDYGVYPLHKKHEAIVDMSARGTLTVNSTTSNSKYLKM